MSPTTHLVSSEVTAALSKREDINPLSSTRCCHLMVLEVMLAGDRVTHWPNIANCPESHCTVSGKDN